MSKKEIKNMDDKRVLCQCEVEQNSWSTRMQLTEERDLTEELGEIWQYFECSICHCKIKIKIKRQGRVSRDGDILYYKDLHKMKFKAGQRIKLTFMKEDPSWNKTLKKGDLGTVESVSHVEALNETQVWVKFDNGSHLALLVGVDEFEIVKNIQKNIYVIVRLDVEIETPTEDIAQDIQEIVDGCKHNFEFDDGKKGISDFEIMKWRFTKNGRKP